MLEEKNRDHIAQKILSVLLAQTQIPTPLSQDRLVRAQLGVFGYPVSWSVPLSLQVLRVHSCPRWHLGKGKLAPGFDAEMIVKNMFTNQDRNGDGKVTAENLNSKDQETKHDEL